jgi:hypothetical protein
MTAVEILISIIVLGIHITMTCLTFEYCLGKETGGNFTLDKRWARRLYVFMMLFIPIGPLWFMIGGAIIEDIYDKTAGWRGWIKMAIEAIR